MENSFTEITGQGIGYEITDKVNTALENFDSSEPETYLDCINRKTKEILWISFTNKVLNYSLFMPESMSGQSREYLSLPLLRLVCLAVVSQLEFICYFVMVLNFALNPSLISVFLPLSMLFYALLENPKPSVKYWKTVIAYMTIVVFLKLCAQLPVWSNKDLH